MTITRKSLLQEYTKADAELEECVKTNDLMAFKRLLGLYAAHESREQKDEWIEQFKRLVIAWKATYQV
jgi:hypothetical protein